MEYCIIVLFLFNCVHACHMQPFRHGIHELTALHEEDELWYLDDDGRGYRGECRGQTDFPEIQSEGNSGKPTVSHAFNTHSTNIMENRFSLKPGGCGTSLLLGHSSKG